MSKVIEEQFLTGERALFGAKDMKINYTTFDDGESPLKESSDISLYYSMFKWKYPVWYSKNIFMNDCTLFETARSGIWYTDNISYTVTFSQFQKASFDNNFAFLISIFFDPSKE